MIENALKIIEKTIKIIIKCTKICISKDFIKNPQIDTIIYTY